MNDSKIVDSLKMINKSLIFISTMLFLLFISACAFFVFINIWVAKAEKSIEQEYEKARLEYISTSTDIDNLVKHINSIEGELLKIERKDGKYYIGVTKKGP